MSNDDTIRGALNSILAPHDAAWEQGFVDAFVARAEHNFKEWQKELTTGTDRRPYAPRYVIFGTKGQYIIRPATREECIAALNAGAYLIDREEATKDGKGAYNECREAFVLHTIDKVGYACQGVDLSTAHFDGAITLGRLIEGYLNVSFGSTTFRVTLQVKTNYRYGSNSANGHLTQYSQYPLTFAYAVVNGEQLSGNLSEELLANKISGIPLDFKIRKSQAEKDAKAAKRAEKKALETTRYGLGRIIDAYDAIAYHTRNLEALSAADRTESNSLRCISEHQAEVAKLCTKYGITDPGSKKAALAVRKALIAQIKATK